MCREPRDENRTGHENDRIILHEAEHDDDDPVAETVVEAITEVSDDTVAEIEPLYESISPDALEDLFDRQSDDSVPARVEFRHEGYEVIIERDGRVAICDPS
ncbi:HalOD1 output domain-containing protein [Haladaptatus sp. DFWS20]|uniref:HalOD1 output domain-containing protein n=1 Tax=Haladaptatus sp. DFWS20 TaxID=3403467 RepID=UPI003EBCBA7E